MFKGMLARIPTMAQTAAAALAATAALAACGGDDEGDDGAPADAGNEELLTPLGLRNRISQFEDA